MDSLDVHCYREEADVLREYLLELKTDLVEEDQDRPQQDQLDRKRFLEEFPRVKRELEESIAKLHALADKVDKVHRDCTITNVVANSAGAVSGPCNWSSAYSFPSFEPHFSHCKPLSLWYFVMAAQGN